MIKGVYIYDVAGESVFTKVYWDFDSKQLIVEFILKISSYLRSSNYGGEVGFQDVATERIFYLVKEGFTFIIVTDEFDSISQIESIITQLAETYLGEYATHDLKKDREFEAIVDEKIFIPIEIALLGFAGVGKTTILHLVRGETLPLVHVPTFRGDSEPPRKFLEELKNIHIITWELGGQSRFRILWAKMIQNASLVLVVTDSTLENVLRSKKLISLVNEEDPDVTIIGIANKQDVPNALKPERVSKILGVPTDGLIAIDITSIDDLQFTRRAILELLMRQSIMMYLKRAGVHERIGAAITSVLLDNESDLIAVLKKIDAELKSLDSLGNVEILLDVAFTKDSLQKLLQNHLEKNQITTETINSIVIGLEIGVKEAQDELYRILSSQSIPKQIINWIISRMSTN